MTTKVVRKKKLSLEELAHSYIEAWGLRCVDDADFEDFLAWFSITFSHIRLGLLPKGKISIHTFCDEADKHWCREMVKEGRCVHMERYNTIGKVIEMKGETLEHNNSNST